MEVIGVGALNLDKLYLVDRIAKGGEEIPIRDVKEAPGGSAANTIAGLARLGIETGFIGKVGEDEEGERMLNAMEKEEVDVRGIVRSKGRSGIIIGIVDEGGERALYAYPGVNDELRMNKTCVDYAKEAKFLHMSSFVGETSYKAQKELLEELRDVKLSFSPGMLYAKKGLKELKPLLEKSHIVFVNEEELKLIAGCDAEKGAKMLLEAGCKIVAVTLGAEGCLCVTDKESHSIEAFETEVIDTTGAGDAFAAGFLYGIIKGKDLKTCGKLGNWIAARCISSVGARAGLPYADELPHI